MDGILNVRKEARMAYEDVQELLAAYSVNGLDRETNRQLERTHRQDTTTHRW